MRIQFVGTGDAFGSGGRFQTCMRLSDVERAGQAILVDCGTTSLTALKAQGIDPSSVGAVVISHLHGDHFGGLPFLILDGQFSRRTSPLLVAGPPGIRIRLAQAMEVLFAGSTGIQRKFDVEITEIATDGKPSQLGEAVVRGWQVDHASGAPALAVRVDLHGTAFAYSGDTQWTPALVQSARDADLFAAEAYTFDRPIRYHLDYATLRGHVEELAARRVVLTHMSADMLGKLADADLPGAYDGMTVDI
jgi:ribonuclease BN (tRNA processing enzyme)